MANQKTRPTVYDKARCARLAAVQALFQSQLTGNSLGEIQKEFQDFRFGSDDYPSIPNGTLFNSLLQEVAQSFDEIIALLESVLSEESKLSRQEPVIKATLFIATAELMNPALSSAPAPVIITEYVEITAGFSDSKQAAFINRILDQIARKLGCSLSLSK
mgnify:CR=1 FL=1|tara:strand:+ start:3651 stop:4130 length:480 start_codon:yes stop_codon:yes gene_type:complete